MITITDRNQTLLPGSATAKFIGAEHGADISFFWVDVQAGKGPDLHWHPYTETWVVLAGEARIEADNETFEAHAGNIVTVVAETVHRFRSLGGDNLQMLCIHASPEIIQEFIAG
ncbi:cupin domain-containing protein [Brevibacterium sp. UCMA 11752]|uniref:cupin domain-containing protein n=1 Tax=Brevibacterium sp. UCMA 11752 TaxID=2745946 RepID=UPI001F1AD19C|nr:cupin domain-containing protein [Brevibacterium sp. UCMA 11752]MCF2585845.1 cupin domain-containing protein [Brevibacterium sp. UCMA 11752]